MSVEFDPSSAAFARDPYAVYRELRSLGAPLYFEDADMLLLSRFRDVRQLLATPIWFEQPMPFIPQRNKKPCR